MYVKEIDFSKMLNFSETVAAELFENVIYPWEVLPLINNFILKLFSTLDKNKYYEFKSNVWVSKNANISSSALVEGPAIIQCNSEIRHNAFIRGNVIIGENNVIGNSCEVKNSILFNSVQVPHFNYVGDSILGYKSHLGAGAILSNVRSDKKNIIVKSGTDILKTGLRKFGAVIGDFCEIGCNAVINPGTILEKNVVVYPTSMVRGWIKENYIFKNSGDLVQKR